MDQQTQQPEPGGPPVLTDPSMDGPGWSVLIPAYNRPQRLQACLQSLAELEPPEGGFEVVVVDDGSSPPLSMSVRVPIGLDARIIRQDNAGPAAARNRAAAEARGLWLAFTDDDCRPHPAWLRTLQLAAAGRDDVIVGGHTENALPRCAPSSASQLLIDYLHDYFNSQDAGPTFFPSNNFCISKRAYQSLGGFDERFPLAAAEDRDFCDRALGAGLVLVYERAAVIDHYHKMSVKGFWRQHFNYGRGAYAFHQARAKRDQQAVKTEPLRFYTGLVFYPLRKGFSLANSWRCALMALSQVANTAGYFRERWFGRRTPGKG